MQTDLTVFVTGESGTGKELVARALHDFGKRRKGPFVAVNMAAIPKELIEAELFGHEKGAFTGAAARSAGRFEQAEGGTLFLDEIGDMPMDAQTRLLRVLQEGEYTTVGGATPISTDIRIITATNRDLQQAIRQGVFREDLYYRINVVPLRIPPLRERLSDIPDLVARFLEQAAGEGLPAKEFDAGALAHLQGYHWPGNVRELENIVRRLVALYSQETITAELVAAELSGTDPHSPAASLLAPISLHDAVEQHMAALFADAGEGLPPPGLYGRVLHEIEAPLLRSALAATGGNQIRAAEVLGLNRNTLRKKINDLEIRIIRGTVE